MPRTRLHRSLTAVIETVADISTDPDELRKIIAWAETRGERKTKWSRTDAAIVKALVNELIKRAA